ncbi:hypothetical protein FDF74_10055 [Clostridium niameyense]|uniref:DUF8052 domain-containing protein n=1 Tax=Clostridium niameyense TaxID=1622073 RepID=A0A6M0RB65_9CLOT|nr:hypothetical protein [Clostridium niameyense]NEZ47534.1 hypothetical protein [Clostridium niameyense]
MESQKYMERLINSYKTYFKVQRNISILANKLDVFATCNLVNVRTMLTENDIIDSFETNEYCFVKEVNEISEDFLDGFTKMLIKAESKYVSPHKDHKSSYITGIILSNTPVNFKIKKFIKKFKYCKAYKFYWYGWCDIRLILVDLTNEEIITNKAAKVVKKVYQVHFNKE